MGWLRNHRIAAGTALALCAGAVVVPGRGRAELARPGPHAFAPAAVERVHAHVAERLGELEPSARAAVARTLIAEARAAGLDPLVVVAVIQVESSFDPAAISPVGAVGLMQLRERTLRAELARHGLAAADPRDPVANVQAGVRYLSRLVTAFGSFDLALMAYNAGPGRIVGHLRAGGVPERFRVYPQRVRHELERLRRLYALERPAGGPAPALASLAAHRIRPDAGAPALCSTHRVHPARWSGADAPCAADARRERAALVLAASPHDAAPPRKLRDSALALGDGRRRGGRRVRPRHAATRALA